MRELVFQGPGRVAWREVEPPQLIEPTDALVEPVAVARCDLDTAILAGEVPVNAPFPLGHEFVARVVSNGPGVRAVTPGDIVVVPFQLSCGVCPRCCRGWTATCAEVPAGAMYGAGDIGGAQWGGAYADLVRVPFADHLLVPVPAGVSIPQAATVSDNLADAWRAVAPPLAAEPGAGVLVVGGRAASIGVWAAELAVVLGASQVTYLDTDPVRCGLAEAAGAEAVIGPPPRRTQTHPITVDASGDPAGLACAIRSTEANHTCTSVAIYWEDPPLPFMHMYARNLTLSTGRVNSRAVIPAMLDLVAAGRIDPLRIATLVDWDDTGTWAAAPTKAIARRHADSHANGERTR